MKTSPLLTVGVLISLLLSSISLAYQVKSKTPSKFEKYMVPDRQTELEHKLERADVRMIQDMSPMYQGLSIGKVWGVSDQNRQVIVRILVSEKQLPEGYDERKKAMQIAAIEAAASVVGQFEKDEVSYNDVRVEFRSIDDLVRNNDKNYAVYSNGELTFH
jgi:hypothetical protein